MFYDWNNDSVVDHVGIVQYSKDDKIVTVEGNTSDINHEENVCAVKTRTKEHVYGYGVPAYPFNSNVEGSNLEEQVYNYLCKAGFSKASTCGIMGNMYQESGVNPSNIQGGDMSMGKLYEKNRTLETIGGYGKRQRCFVDGYKSTVRFPYI